MRHPGDKQIRGCDKVMTMFTRTEGSDMMIWLLHQYVRGTSASRPRNTTPGLSEMKSSKSAEQFERQRGKNPIERRLLVPSGRNQSSQTVVVYCVIMNQTIYPT